MTDTTVLLVTKDSDGTPWCIADDLTRGPKAASNTTYGTTDGQTVADCNGDVSVWG